MHMPVQQPPSASGTSPGGQGGGSTAQSAVQVPAVAGEQSGSVLQSASAAQYVAMQPGQAPHGEGEPYAAPHWAGVPAQPASVGVPHNRPRVSPQAGSQSLQ